MFKFISILFFIFHFSYSIHLKRIQNLNIEFNQKNNKEDYIFTYNLDQIYDYYYVNFNNYTETITNYQNYSSQSTLLQQNMCQIQETGGRFTEYSALNISQTAFSNILVYQKQHSNQYYYSFISRKLTMHTYIVDLNSQSLLFQDFQTLEFDKNDNVTVPSNKERITLHLVNKTTIILIINSQIFQIMEDKAIKILQVDNLTDVKITQDYLILNQGPVGVVIYRIVFQEPLIEVKQLDVLKFKEHNIRQIQACGDKMYLLDNDSVSIYSLSAKQTQFLCQVKRENIISIKVQEPVLIMVVKDGYIEYELNFSPQTEGDQQDPDGKRFYRIMKQEHNFSIMPRDVIIKENYAYFTFENQIQAIKLQISKYYSTKLQSNLFTLRTNQAFQFFDKIKDFDMFVITNSNQIVLYQFQQYQLSIHCNALAINSNNIFSIEYLSNNCDQQVGTQTYKQLSKEDTQINSCIYSQKIFIYVRFGYKSTYFYAFYIGIAVSVTIFLLSISFIFGFLQTLKQQHLYEQQKKKQEQKSIMGQQSEKNINLNQKSNIQIKKNKINNSIKEEDYDISSHNDSQNFTTQLTNSNNLFQQTQQEKGNQLYINQQYQKAQMISPAASSLSPIALKYQIDLKNIIIETESDKKQTARGPEAIGGRNNRLRNNLVNFQHNNYQNGDQISSIAIPIGNKDSDQKNYEEKQETETVQNAQQEQQIQYIGEQENN